MLTYYVVSALGLALQPYGAAMAWVLTYIGIIVIILTIAYFNFFDVHFDATRGKFITRINKISLVFLLIGPLMLSEVFLYRSRAYECVNVKFEISKTEEQLKIPADQMKLKVCRYIDEEIWNIKE